MAMTTWAVMLDARQAEEMRALAAELVKDHMDGLSERARAVGYARESMHLQPTEDGGALLLVHVDPESGDYSEVRERIRTYPETDFTRWFNPRFLALLPSGSTPPIPELLFEWRDKG